MHRKKNSIKKICLITPGHISTNPRLVKEATALVEAGYEVHLIFTQYMDYLVEDDQLLLKNNPLITYTKLLWTSGYKFLRFRTGLLQKIGILLSKIFKSITIFNKIVLNRNYNWQYQQAVLINADLYIAHNVGALPVAASAAKKNGVFFGFDAEDFHRGEDLSTYFKESIIYIENKYLPVANYISAGSPLIAEAYGSLYKKEVVSILNVFPKPNLKLIEKGKNSPVKLFWFSQTIGLGRGIEDIISAMALLEDKTVELHLLGNCEPEMKKKINDMASSSNHIFYYHPVFPDKIFDLVSEFDIGMATETGVPLNRDICLTNKIFTYLQSGLAVIASDTKAQKDLLKKHPEIGRLYPKGNSNSLASIIELYQNDRMALDMAKQQCKTLGETVFNWEREKKMFLSIIKTIN